MLGKLTPLAALVAWIGVQRTQANEFIPLGDLPGGFFSSSAQGVNASGTVVVGGSSNDSSIGGGGAFVWTEAGGMGNIGDGASAEAVSSDGSTAVGFVSDGTALTPFVWNASSGGRSLGLPPGETPSGATTALGVSGDGSVVVGSTVFDGAVQAFRWTTSTGFTSLASDFPAGVSSAATAISDNGQVIVGNFNDGERKAFRWEATSGVTELGNLPGGNVNTRPLDVSADGEWVVGWSSPSRFGFPLEAFLWSEATGMVGVGLPAPAESLAYAVTDGGNAVVGHTFVLGVSSDAFVWTDAGGTELLQGVLESRFGLGAALNGWKLSEARDISADGRSIVGRGTNPDGNIEAWLVRLDVPIYVPEPGALHLILPFLLATAEAGRRHR